MKEPYQVILKPLITEKSTILRESNKYAFVVDSKSTKSEIRQAAEEIFDLKGKITQVNTMCVHGKPKGKLFRYRIGKRPNWKKAIITIQEGVSIQLFEGI
jgi:large subunit ribosomal protein L23